MVDPRYSILSASLLAKMDRNSNCADEDFANAPGSLKGVSPAVARAFILQSEVSAQTMFSFEFYGSGFLVFFLDSYVNPIWRG
ncbi:hypothetical protein F4806DRAFT_324643 [Annulohypoxylon nitens]|nr:hypothetical protein F4806DRAFT_324643 [Annulohypoxylon nitens]